MKSFSSKQAFFFTIINYLGVLIGIFSTLFIYPQHIEFLGLVRFVDGWAQLLYPILVLGSSQALLNYQPLLTTLQQQKLWGFSLQYVAIRSVLLLLIFVGIQWILSSDYEYLGFAIPMAICLALIDLIKKESTFFQKLSFPTFFEKIIPKLALPAVFLLILYKNTSFFTALSLYTCTYVLIVAIVGFYIQRWIQPVFRFEKASLFESFTKKDYQQYAIYAFAASLGSFFAFRIDSIMIPIFLSKEANGFFNIGVNIANMLMIPAIGLFSLHSPWISAQIKNKNWKDLQNKYQSSGCTLFYIGALVWGCIFLGANDFFALLPTAEKLQTAVPVILILGGSVLMNMSTSFNTEILTFSSLYKYNLYAILFAALLNISLNYLLLTSTTLGIVGVAWASLISMLLYNVFKALLIYNKMGLTPINGAFVKLLLIGVCSLLMCNFIDFELFGFGFLIKIGAFVVLFGGLGWKWSYLSFFLKDFLKRK